jgi:DNA-binding response OmpR family regulator
VASRQRILICDDDPLLVELLLSRLRAKGYDVSVARDGCEAAHCVTTDPPDAVILDAMMPVADGFEVLRLIRRNPALDAVAVLMLSARRHERDVLLAMELGANDYMVKPFSPNELSARLAKLLADTGAHRDTKETRSTRSSVSIRSELYLPDDREVECHIRDISETGFMGEARIALAPGTSLGISIPEFGIVRAQIRWCDGERLGGRFDRKLNLQVLEGVLPT